MQNTTRVITWNTKKENGTYTALVVEIGYNYAGMINRTSGFKTRARAKTYAQKMAKYLKAKHATNPYHIPTVK